MTITQQPRTRAQRVRELLASLPKDCGVFPASDLLGADERVIECANEIPVAKDVVANEIPVTIHMDGATLVCAVCVAPQHYQDAEVERHDLPAMKGATDTTLQELERTE